MSNAHVAAFTALLTAGDVAVDDAEAPNFASLPRVVLYADPGASERGTLEGSADGVVITIQTTCLGQTREQAGWLLDRVRELVEDQRPVVAGWDCTRIENLFSNLPRRDDDVDPAVFYVVSTWRFTAVPVTPA